MLPGEVAAAGGSVLTSLFAFPELHASRKILRQNIHSGTTVGFYKYMEEWWIPRLERKVELYRIVEACQESGKGELLNQVLGKHTERFGFMGLEADTLAMCFDPKLASEEEIEKRKATKAAEDFFWQNRLRLSIGSAQNYGRRLQYGIKHGVDQSAWPTEHQEDGGK